MDHLELIRTEQALKEVKHIFAVSHKSFPTKFQVYLSQFFFTAIIGLPRSSWRWLKRCLEMQHQPHTSPPIYTLPYTSFRYGSHTKGGKIPIYLGKQPLWMRIEFSTPPPFSQFYSFKQKYPQTAETLATEETTELRTKSRTTTRKAECSTCFAIV